MHRFARIWTLITYIASIQICDAYRVLIMSPFPSMSHAILGEELVKTILKAGHEVAYITGMPKRLEAHPKLVEVDVSFNEKYFPSEFFNLTNILENRMTVVNPIEFLSKITSFCEKNVNNEATKRVLNDGRRFDLVIAEWMFSEMYAGLPAVLDCPLIWFSTMEPHSLIVSLIEGNLHPAYNVEFGLETVVPFSFFERIQQLASQIIVALFRKCYIYFKETSDFNNLYTPLMEKIGKTLPSYEELRYNASLVLSNSHVSLGQPTSLPSNFISIGGYHVDPEVKPLPEALKNIMDNARNGVIFFSMGSILNSKHFPQKLKMDLLDMFGRLKQTVLWKFEEDFQNLPSNVHVLKWASQQSILAHPNCVLFISHGGLLSLTESIHYAVPVIGMPGFADQFANVLRAESKGFAKKVNLSHNLAKELEIAIYEVIGNPRYKEKVKELSFVYHDRPIHPRKELVHWVEHVIKTRGAPLLRSPALQLPFYQKYYIDLAVLIVVVIFVSIGFIKCVMKKFLRQHSGSKIEIKSSKKKKE